MVSNPFFMDRSQESQLQAQILEQISDAVIAIDNHHCVIYCNRVALNQYKLEESGAIGKPLQECYTYIWLKPEDERLALEALETQGHWQGENIHCLWDGTEIFVESKVTILKDVSGNSIGMLATIRDTSDRKKAELALSKSKSESAAILSAIPDLMFRVGSDGTYRDYLANQEFALLPQSIDIKGRSMAEILAQDHADRQFHYLQKALETGEVQIYEQTIQLSNRTLDEEVRVVKSGEDEVLFIVRDINDRKRMEKALQASEAKSRAILAALPDLMIRANAEGVHLEFLNGKRDICIIPENVEMVGRPMADLIPAEVWERHSYHIHEAIETGELQVYEQTVQLRDRQHQEEVRIIKYTEDEVLFIIRDINDRKQTELALKESEAKNKAILSTIPDLMFKVRSDGVYLECINHRELSLIPPDIEIVEQRMTELLPQELAIAESKILQKAIETGELQVCEHSVQVGDRIRDEELRVIKSGEDEALFMIRDISDRKEAERALQESESRFRRLAEYAPMLIWMSDVDKQCFYFNQTWLDFTGRNLEQELGEGWVDAVHPEDLPHCLEISNHSFDAHHNFEKEYRLRRYDGEYRWILDCGAPRFDGDGNFLGYIGSCIDIDDRKELQKLLLESEAKLNDILNSVRSAVIRLIVSEDGSWGIDYISNGCEAICGYSVEELTLNKKLWVSRIDPADWQEIEPQIYEDIFIGREGTHTYRLMHRDGFWRWISQKNTSRWDFNLNAWIVTVISADITDRKRIEIDLQKSQAALLEAQAIAHIGSWEFDIQSHKITWSPELFRMFGLDPNQPEPSYSEFLQLVHPDDSKRLHHCVEQAIAHGITYQIEYRPILPDGSIRYHEGKGEIERDKLGQIKRLFGTALDITDRVATQMALEELNRALQHSEAKNRAILAAIPDLMIRANAEGVHLEYVGEKRELCIIPEDVEMIGRSMADLIPADVWQRHSYHIEKALETGELQVYEQTVQLRDRPHHEEVRLIKYAEDEVLFIIRDINARKQSELALKENEAKQKAILAAIPDLMFRVRSDGVYLECVNHRELSLIPPDIKMEGRSMTELLPEELAINVLKVLQKTLETGELQGCETRIQVGDRTLDEEVRVIKSGEDEVLFIVRDISDRKQAELALKESEIRKQAIIDAIPDLLLRVTRDGTCLECLLPHGTQAGKYVPINNHLSEILPPDIFENQLQAIERAIATGELQIYNQQLIKFGKLTYEEVRVAAINDSEALIIVRDATAQVELGNRLEEISYHVPGMIYQYRLRPDGSSHFPYTSQGILDIYAVSPNDVSEDATVVLGRIHPADLDNVSQAIADSAKYLTIWQNEYRVCLPDGRMIWVNGQATPQRQPDGSILWHGYITEITTRKQSEEALRELNQELERKVEERTAALRRSKEALQISERRFRNFFNYAPIGIAVVDVQTYQFVAVNSSLCQILGYTEAELLGISSYESMTIPSISVADDWKMQRPYYEALLYGGESSFYQFDRRYIRKDGEIITCNLTLTIIKDEDGNVTHFLGMVEDVTNRKLMEESLRYSEELLRSTIESTPLGMCTLSLEGKFLTVNQFICQIFGYEVKEMLAFTALDLTHPDFLAATIQNLQRIIAGEISNYAFEKQYLHKSGSIIDAISRVSLVRDKNGNPLQFVVVVENITERKQMETVLQWQMERQQFLMSITQQIRQSLNLNEILNTAVTEVKNLLNGDRVIIFRLFNDGLCRILKEAVDPQYLSILNGEWMDREFSNYESFDYYITPSPRIINNVYNDEWSKYLSEFMAEAGIKSKIVAPIVQNIILRKEEGEEQKWRKGNSVLWGALVVQSCGEYRRWEQQEADLLQQVANQLAIAIQQSDVYERVRNELFTRKQYEQELIRQAAEDRILAEITAAINQAFTIDTNLNTSLEKVRQFLNCDRILIYELNADGTGNIFKEAVSRSELSILGETVDDVCFAKTDIGKKYLEGKITALDNIEKLDDTCYINLLRQFDVKANLVLPIVHSQQLWGLFIIHQCDHPRSWQSSEIKFTKQIAEQISSAAQKEKLYLQLTSELKQKGTLLKEIHHRVKNNLQIMSSLLRLQFRRTGEEVREIAEEYQNRIQSMALIHDQLYRSEDLSHINFHNYLQNLAAHLFFCYSTNSELIKLNIEVNDISLPLDISIPLGLIINELLSNTLKYAFPQGHGAIDIKLETLGKDMSLVVADNGIGLPLGFDYENTDSLGMQLVLTLTDQLGGKVNYIRDDGATFQITFPMEEFT